MDPRLTSDSTHILDLELCHVRLSHNAAFPWIILIPKPEGIVEIIDLKPADQLVLMQEISVASHVMKDLFQPTKLNVANLGNVVPQLHIHVVARYDSDGAWPGPIWNSGITAVYDVQVKSERIELIQKAFAAKSMPSFHSPLKQVYALSLEAAQEGFDWESPFQAALKVQEELDEVLEELKKNPSPARQDALKDEIGDLFMASSCLARHCNVDPEEAITAGIEKFIRRYTRLKSYAEEKGISLHKASQSELTVLWQELKKKRVVPD